MANVEITEEMLSDLKRARERLIPISEPGVDLEVLTLTHLIEECEEHSGV